MARKRKHHDADAQKTAELNRQQSQGSETVVVTAERAHEANIATGLDRFTPKSPYHDKAWEILKSMSDVAGLDAEHLSDAQRGLIQQSMPQFFGENKPLASAKGFDKQIARLYASYPDLKTQPMDDQIKFIVGNNLVSHKIMTMAEIDAALDGKDYPKPPSVYTAANRRMYPDKVLERWQRYVNDHYDGGPINLVSPMGGDAVVTSAFGHRKQPMPGASTDHGGVDIASNKSNRVVAAGDGIVLVSGTSHTVDLKGYDTPNGLGNYNDVGTKDGRTVYRNGELAKVSDMPKAGQVVEAGYPMGTQGVSGVSTGPHVHFEVLVDGKKVSPSLNGHTKLAKGTDLPATPVVPMKDRKGREVPLSPDTQPELQPPATAALADVSAVPDYKPTYKNAVDAARKLKDVTYASLDTVQRQLVVTALNTYPGYADLLKGYDVANDLDRGKMFDHAVNQYLAANGFDNSDAKNAAFTAQQQLKGLIAFDLAKRENGEKLLRETHINLADFNTPKRREAIMREAREVGNVTNVAYTPDTLTVATGTPRLLARRIADLNVGDASRGLPAQNTSNGDYIELTYITPDGQIFKFDRVLSGGANMAKGNGTLPSLDTTLTTDRGLTYGIDGLMDVANSPEAKRRGMTVKDYGPFVLVLNNPSSGMDKYDNTSRGGFLVEGGEAKTNRGCAKIFDKTQYAQFMHLVQKYGVPKELEIVSDGLMAAVEQANGQVQLASASGADILPGGGGHNLTKAAPRR
jgi:murein DD-endopeptidase MepM/ murein hydrolase activator NlpD